MKTEHLSPGYPPGSDSNKWLHHHQLQEPNRESSTGKEFPGCVVIYFLVTCADWKGLRQLHGTHRKGEVPSANRKHG